MSTIHNVTVDAYTMASTTAYELEHIAPRSSAPQSSAADKGAQLVSTQTPLPSPVVSREQSPAPVLGDNTDAAGDRQEFSLPPVDGGKDAWLFLAACCLVEALVWGFPYSFGIFQDYYRAHDNFKESSDIAVIGTCALGIMYLDVPLFMALQRMFPRVFRYGPFVGLLVMCIALGLSSLSQTTTHLILSQGILFAIGGSICYCPCLFYLNEWFVERKGLAYGVMWSGTGIGGFAIPMLLEYFLGRYGFRTTLRIWTVALFVLTIPLVYFIKPRLPPSATTHIKAYKLGFVFDRFFVLYFLANFIEALGFFLPGIYLPSYARSTLGAGSFPAALTIIAVNIASTFGCVVMGFLIDRLHVTTCIMLSTLGTVISTFLLWGLATNLPVLYVFCIMYGFFAGAYTSTWPGIMRQIGATPSTSSDSAASTTHFDPMMIFGILALSRGVGNMVSGPLSEALFMGMPWKGQAFGGYGSGYGSLITFTGITAVVGGAPYVCKKIGWMNY
ncbi:MFS transporter asaE [Paramyrothecium foliicola]|nr:MFS transporter asaE [Paramyrothecium foliicola]